MNPLDDDAARANIIAASMVDAGNWLIVAMLVRQGINGTSDDAMSGAWSFSYIPQKEWWPAIDRRKRRL